MAEQNNPIAATDGLSPTPSRPTQAMAFGRYDYAVFLTYIVYAAASIVIPVSLVSVARDLGFRLDEGGMTAGGALQIGRTLACVTALLLCGFLAGRWGMRRILGASVVLMAVGIGICAFAPRYGVVFLALMIAGLGEGVIEGLATPFVQALHTREPGRYVNFAHAFWSVGVLMTVLAAGALLSSGVSWRLVVGGIAVSALLPATMLLTRPAREEAACPEPHDTPGPQSVAGKARFILGIPRF